jgi:5-methylcytosine-specific restriction protein A
LPIKAKSFHQQRPLPDRRPSASRRGYDRAWQTFRLYHLREHPLCVFREHPSARADCLRAATIVDHVVPLQAGGARLDADNVRSVCRCCHAKLTANCRHTGRNEIG